MKKEIAKYVDKCLICQKVKAKHQRPISGLRPLDIRTWKLDSISRILLWVFSFQLARITLSNSY